MEYVIGGIAVALVVAAAIKPVRDRVLTTAPLRASHEDIGLFGADAEELLARFAAAELQDDPTRLDRVARQLAQVRNHRVPLRTIDAATGPGIARLRFADGTAVLARSATPGQLPNVAMARHKAAITIGSIEPVAHGIRVNLAWRGKERATLVAVGLDQAD